MAGPTHPLQAGGHAGGRLDVDDEVHRAHVDAQLQRRGRHHGRQLTPLEQVLDDDPLLARHRAVMGAGDLIPRQVVQLGAEPFGQPAGVGEHDGGPVGSDQVQQGRVHGGPDGPVPRVGGLGCERVGRCGRGHVLDRDHDLHLEAPLAGDIHDGDRPRRPGAAVHGPASHELGDGRQGLLGGGETDAEGTDGRHLFQPLQREGQVRSPLGPGHGVDLVEDDPPDRSQHLAGRAGEDQEQGLGGGDEDVRGVALHALAVGGRGVSGADGGHHLGRGRQAVALGGVGDPGQGRPEVALHVMGQGLHRRDVEDPAAPGLGRHGFGKQLVERVEERSQRLARPGGGVDQRVLTGRDGRPSTGLSLGGAGERLLEPGGGSGRKQFSQHL